MTSSVAAVALAAANEITEFYAGHLEHVDSYIVAAAWLVFVGVAAVSYHGIIISFRILYCAAKIGHSFARFSFTVSNCLSATD